MDGGWAEEEEEEVVAVSASVGRKPPGTAEWSAPPPPTCSMRGCMYACTYAYDSMHMRPTHPGGTYTQACIW